MSYRPQLSSMDKDTILFVRKNRMALAYHWDFYVGAVSMISKEFMDNPPSAAYYKAANTFDSWVHVDLSMLDGLYARKFTIPEAARMSYANRSRLVSNMNVEIPCAIYIDAEGYEHSIGLNDGTEIYVFKEKFTSGKTGKDIEITQFSINQPSLPFTQRHLMDDVKLKFNRNISPANTLITFNSLIHPVYLEINDPQIAYIREGLRMSTYTCITDDDRTLKIPLKINIASQAIITPGIEVKDFKAYVVGNDTGVLMKVNNDGSIQRSLTNGLSWDDLVIPPFDTTGEPDVTIEGLEYTTNKVDLVPMPASKTQWFAYKSASIGKDPTKLFYCISIDNGATWTAIPYTVVDLNCEEIIVLPYINERLIIKARINGNDILYQSNDCGLNWFPFQAVKDLEPIQANYGNVELIRSVYRTTRNMGSNHFVTKIWDEDPDKWILNVKHGQEWFKSYSFYREDIGTLLGGFIGGVVVNFDYAFQYDESSAMIHIPFTASITKSSVTKQYSGQLMSTDSGSNWRCIFTNKTIEELAIQTNTTPLIAVGEHAVKFSDGPIVYAQDKWLIFDTITGRFRCSEDFINWYPTTGMTGNENDVLNVTKYDQLTFDSTKIYYSMNEGGYIKLYTIPNKRIYHYDLRVKAYKWIGINATQQLRAEYIVWDQDSKAVGATKVKPLRIGFPINLNPNACMLLYNGLPILNDSAYVNPENPREMCIENPELYKALQRYTNPIQFFKNRRDYIHTDFAVINFEASDPTKTCYMFKDKGFVSHAGKECYVDFHSDIMGDCILFNGVDHEYIITGKKSIKYIISRYGLHEAIYPRQRYMFIGNYNIRTDIARDVYRIQFVIKDRR